MSDGATPPCEVSPVTPSRSRIVRSYCSLVRRATCEVTATPAVHGIVVVTEVPPVPALPVRMTPVPAVPPVPLLPLVVTPVPAAPVALAPAEPLADPVVLPAPEPELEEEVPT